MGSGKFTFKFALGLGQRTSVGQFAVHDPSLAVRALLKRFSIIMRAILRYFAVDIEVITVNFNR